MSSSNDSDLIISKPLNYNIVNNGDKGKANGMVNAVLNENKNLIRLKEYSQLKMSKVFKKGGKSKYIHLIEGNIVKKRYSYKNPDHVIHFNNEVMILQKLKDCDFIPKILALDQKKLIIYMTYCGNSIDLLGYETYKKYHDEINQKIKLLESKWGLIRYQKITKNPNLYKDKDILIDGRNICLKDNKIYLIDFGSPLWKLKYNKK